MQPLSPGRTQRERPWQTPKQGAAAGRVPAPHVPPQLCLRWVRQQQAANSLRVSLGGSDSPRPRAALYLGMTEPGMNVWSWELLS